MMKLNVNGQERTVQPGATMETLLEQMELSPRRVAVERNRELLPRKLYDQTELADGDEIEIVTLVGGG
jgi:thiamine biosynthesis protein ThiS